jgi:ribonuclease G
MLIDKIENTLADFVEKYKLKSTALRLHPFIASHINKGWLLSIRSKWQRKYGCKIKIVPISSFDFLEFRFFNAEGKELSH